MLIAVKGSSRSSQRVVLENHAEIGSAVVAFEPGYKGGIKSGNRKLNIEVVQFEVVDELLDGSMLNETDFGIARDVVREREQLLVH